MLLTSPSLSPANLRTTASPDNPLEDTVHPGMYFRCSMPDSLLDVLSDTLSTCYAVDVSNERVTVPANQVLDI
jgi:hypothetical protein